MNKNNPLVSVIVPIYNIEKLLKRCIDSIVNQTYKNLEIILINDGSTDKSLDICKEYKKKDNRIVLIDQKNMGVAATRNKGLQSANGEFICFIDSDDYIDKTLVEEYVTNIKDSDLLISDYFVVEDGKYKSNVFPLSTIINTKEGIRNVQASLLSNKIKHQDTKLYSGCGFSFLWNKLLKNEIIKKNSIKFPDKVTMSEDASFMFRYLNKVEKITIINKPLYYHEEISSGLTHKFKPNIIESDRKFIDSIKEEIDFNSKLMTDAYYGRLIKMFAGDCKTYIFHSENKESYKETLRKVYELIPEYKTAIKKVKLRNLSIKQKVFVILVRLHLYFVMKIII